MSTVQVPNPDGTTTELEGIEVNDTDAHTTYLVIDGPNVRAVTINKEAQKSASEQAASKEQAQRDQTDFEAWKAAGRPSAGANTPAGRAPSDFPPIPEPL